MKKKFNKIKKIFLIIVAFLSSMWSKVFAGEIQPLYGPGNTGTELPKVSVGERILSFCKNFIVPIAFLIGIIIYFKKSKTSIEKKIVIAFIIGILGWILWSILKFI